MKRLFIYMLFACLIAAGGCRQNNNRHTGKKQAQDTAQTVYTCSMHPQIRLNHPGNCPVCGMKLEPVEQAMQMEGTPTLYLSASQRFFAHIRIDTAKMRALHNEVVLTGTTDFDPRSVAMVSAWAPGRIERLYVRNPGSRIRPGEKLYDLYSEELLSAEKEYLLALRQKALFEKASVDITRTIEALEQKLRRRGLSAAQMNRLRKAGRPDGLVSIYSKQAGYLVRKLKEEGEYVQEGDAVFTLAGSGTLWVQTQLYDTELPLLDGRPRFWVELAAYPGKKLDGQAVFHDPVTENGLSRVQLLSVSITDPAGKLQPGMLAYVHLQTGDGVPALTVPGSAVVYDEKHTFVWVAESDSTFERREVVLGTSNKSRVEIRKGIEAGQRVVSSGVYLLNSEYILQKGGEDAMTGMQM